MPDWEKIPESEWPTMLVQFVTAEGDVGTMAFGLCLRCGGYFGARGSHRKFHEQLDFLADTPRYRRWLRRKP